ncbi:MAG: hypothetical protein WA958_16350 [Tunicatimonas sp.]
MYINKFVNVAWVLTFLLFFAVLTFGYAGLSEQLSLYGNSRLEREAFYYLALVVFVLVNLPALVLRRMLEAVPVSSGLYARNEAFKERIIVWFGGFIVAINACLITLVSYLTQDAGNSERELGFLGYLGPLLLLFSVLWFFSVLTSRRSFEVE